MTPKTKKKPKGRPAQSAAEKEEIRSRIVAVSKDLFIAKGFENISIRKIAHHAGCLPRTIYYYFENKRALLHYLWIDIFRMLSRECDQAIEGIEDPLEIIQIIYKTYVTYWLSHRDQYRVIFMIEDLNATTDHDAAILARIRKSAEFIMHFENAVNACIEKKVFKKHTADRLIQIFFLSAHGLASGLITMREMQWEHPDALIEGTLHALSAGLKQL